MTSPRHGSRSPEQWEVCVSENLLIGSTLGQYQIEALIGRGAVSAVYRAYQANAKTARGDQSLPARLPG